MKQKYISSAGLDEAETSLKYSPSEAENVTGTECIPMVSADSGEGEGYVMHNLAAAAGAEKKEGTPDLHESRPSFLPPHSS